MQNSFKQKQVFKISVFILNLTFIQKTTLNFNLDIFKKYKSYHY